MPSINLPPIEDLDVDDLASLPQGYRYELHEGNLVVMTPSTYWHKVMARRLMFLLAAAGLEVLQDTGIRGDRPRDSRLPDLGVIDRLPPDPADCLRSRAHRPAVRARGGVQSEEPRSVKAF
jgi:Uma2 family endonuclease